MILRADAAPHGSPGPLAQRRGRLHPDDGVARPHAAVLGRLEQERARPVAGELAIGADRRLRIRKQPPRHGDDPLVVQAPPELSQFRRGDAGGHGAGTPTTTSRTSASKHVRSPVWQAAPSWSTRTSTVSPSQSRATDLTHCWWPLVSPLTQYSWRLRLQYVQRPVVRVRCSASSSIHPTIRTSPVSHCCATAQTRPWSSRLRRSAILGSSEDGRTGPDMRSIVPVPALPFSSA